VTTVKKGYQPVKREKKNLDGRTGHNKTVRQNKAVRSSKKNGKKKYRPEQKKNTIGYIPKKRKKKKTPWGKICAAIFAAALLCGVAGFSLWYMSFEKLELEDYVAVTYSGYNTEATAQVSLEESEEYEDFLESVEVKLLSQNGNLENGDVLDIRFIYDEEEAKTNKLRIREDECLVEVEGLPDGKQLSNDDLFSGVRISYEGIAPLLSVSVSNDSTDPFFQTITYRIPDQKTYYDTGDTFTVEAVFSEEEAVVHEYILPDTENGWQKEYSVENADRYIRDASHISEDQIQILNDTAASLFGDANEYGLRIFSEANLMPIWVNGKNTFVWSNPRLISAYLNVLKPEYFETEQSHNNDIKLVYVATLSQADGVACDAEVVVQFTDLVEKADGTCDLAPDSGRIIAASFKNSHIRDLVNDSYSEEYEAVKLEL